MLLPVKYHRRNYPHHIIPGIEELAGHFDIRQITPAKNFSLHTEYSYGIRQLDSDLLKQFPIIQSANKNGVPQLWYSDDWALEFAHFIQNLCAEEAPSVIEIHPPFSDYTDSIESFLLRYRKFEEEIIQIFPDSQILIENRCGSIYKGGRFILSNIDDFKALCSGINEQQLNLRIALDVPQLLTAYKGPQQLKSAEIEFILNNLNTIRDMVDSIHLWGKKKSDSGRTVSHSGNLSTYFGDSEKKKIFLNWFANFLNDNKTRYFVPEVNSNDADLHSIISDLEQSGIQFLDYKRLPSNRDNLHHVSSVPKEKEVVIQKTKNNNDALAEKLLYSPTTDIIDLILKFYPLDKEQLLKYNEVLFDDMTEPSFDDYYESLERYEKDYQDFDIIRTNYEKKLICSKYSKISQYENISWGEDLITAFEGKVRFKDLSRNRALVFTEGLLDKYPDKWSHIDLIFNPSVKWTDSLIEKNWSYFQKHSKSADYMTKKGFLFIYAVNKIIPFKEEYLADYLSVLEEETEDGSSYFVPDAGCILGYDPVSDYILYTENDKQRKNYLLQNSFPFSGDFLEKYKDLWTDKQWGIIAQNTAMHWTIELIEEFQDKWDIGEQFDEDANGWRELAKNESIPWSIEFIEKYKEKLIPHQWASDLLFNKSVPWSIDLIKKIQDRLDPDNWDEDGLNGWESFSTSEAIPWSIELVKTFKEKWNNSEYLHFDFNQTFPWLELIDYFLDDQISFCGKLGKEHEAHVISEWVINSSNLEKYSKFIDFFGLSHNKRLGSYWNIDFIEQNKDELSWWGTESLSANETLPWSVELIEKFKGKWTGLGYNNGITWTEDMVFEYFDNIGFPYECDGLNPSLINVIKDLDKNLVNTILDRAQHYFYGEDYELELRWAYFLDLINAQYDFHPPPVTLENGDVVSPSLRVYDVHHAFCDEGPGYWGDGKGNDYILISRFKPPCIRLSEQFLTSPVPPKGPNVKVNQFKILHSFPLLVDDQYNDLYDLSPYDVAEIFDISNFYYHAAHYHKDIKSDEENLIIESRSYEVISPNFFDVTFPAQACKKAALVDRSEINDFERKKGFKPHERQKQSYRGFNHLVTINTKLLKNYKSSIYNSEPSKEYYR